ncbi:kinase-like domain-containing protein [Rhizophagus irregularis DAOM 181602=DAOM 197198]|nr:kinase-like domain-containing protein [Rhizophagus irregularis DAOM 181602=DAOM 197198]
MKWNIPEDSDSDYSDENNLGYNPTNIDSSSSPLGKRGFGTTFKAVWKDGPWGINFDNKQWERKVDTKVALKCLNNSQDITADFLKEVESNILSFRGLEDDIDKLDSVIYEQVKETDDINKKLYFSSPLKSTEPKNADNNDDLHGIEYSDSLKMDFTKLDINSKDETN